MYNPERQPLLPLTVKMSKEHVLHVKSPLDLSGFFKTSFSISRVSQKDQLGKKDRPSPLHGASSDKPARLVREHSGEQQEETAQACWWEGASARASEDATWALGGGRRPLASFPATRTDLK